MLSICPFRSAKQIGTGSAGILEEGFARVGRDAPVVVSGARGSELADVGPPDAVGDDDFFSVSFFLLSPLPLFFPIFLDFVSCFSGTHAKASHADTHALEGIRG